MQRGLLVALLVSLVLHALALFATQMSLPRAGDPPPLLAELRPSPQTGGAAPAQLSDPPPVRRAAPRPPPARPRAARPSPLRDSAIVASPPASAPPEVAPDEPAPAEELGDAPAADDQPERAAEQPAAPDEVGDVAGAPGMGSVPGVPGAAGAPGVGGDEPAAGEATPPVVVTARLPARGSIRYRVERGDRSFPIGFARQEWEVRADRYRISALSETSGLVALFKRVRVEAESRGRVGSSGLVPEHFVVRRSGRERAEEIDFDWPARQVRMGERPPLALRGGTQDILSLNFQLALLPEHSGVAVNVATGRKLAGYRIEVMGEETIETPAGSFRCLHLRLAGTATTELWLAYEQALLPVKIRHVDRKGDVFVQSATHIDFTREP